MKLIADNLRITKLSIQNALAVCDSKPVQQLVLQCEKRGIFAIDVNTWPLTSFPEKDMTFFIKAVQSVIKLPMLIDTSNCAAMEAGLSNLTTGAKSREKKNLVEQSYLAMLAAAGLDYIMMDVLNYKTLNTAKASDILVKTDIFSWEIVS